MKKDTDNWLNLQADSSASFNNITIHNSNYVKVSSIKVTISLNYSEDTFVFLTKNPQLIHMMIDRCEIERNLPYGEWEKTVRSILFKEKKFVCFIDPGSFFGHNEMEVAYLRWFNPVFVDSKFLYKYNDKIKLDKNYLLYEPVYQLYYALSNVALWDKIYIKETKRLLEKLRL